MSKGTTLRSVRISDEVWLPAKAKAEAEGVSLSDVIRDALTSFTEDQPES